VGVLRVDIIVCVGGCMLGFGVRGVGGWVKWRV
jgi:hypothetical protein